MAKPCLHIASVTPTGERFYVEARRAWGRSYFRCDLSDAGRWHRSLTEARREAARTATLRRVEPTNTQSNQGGNDMSKKTTKHDQKPKAEPELKAKPEPEFEAQPERRAKKAKRGAKEPAAGKPRREREAVLDLETERAEDIKPVRAGTHLAHVLELTARPEGATALELDKAIVTTARSVKHYGVWALRYALHKAKGFGFRTVRTEGEPARYHLVLPQGEELASFVKVTPSSERKPAAAPKPKTAKPAKGHGKKAAEARA